MPRALSTSDGTPPPAMATRVLPSRAAKKRPAEDSSDAEELPKQPPKKKAATAKKTAAKKGTAKKDTAKDVKGKGKAAEMEKEKKPTKGKGKKKVDAVVDDAEEPIAPKPKRGKTTKAATAPKTTTKRAAKRPSPDDDAAPLASTSNAALPGTPPRKRQRLMDDQPVRRSPRRPTASANQALAGNSHAPVAEPARESITRGRGQSIGQRRERAPELAPLILPALLGPILTPSPEPENRETTPLSHAATPPASPRESSRPPSLGTLGLLSQLHNPIIPYAELSRDATPDAEARSPSPAPTEIVHHFQPARERPLDEITKELADAGIKVRDFAWEGVYHEQWKVRAEEVRQRRQRDRERMEAKTEEWDREEVQKSQPATRHIGPPPSQNQQAGPSNAPATLATRALGRAGTVNKVGSAATFPPQPQAASQPAENQTPTETQAPTASPARPPNSQPAPGRRALVRQSRPLDRQGTFYQTPGAGPSNANAGPSNAVAGPSNTTRAMTPVRESTPVADAEENAPRAGTPAAETSPATPIATPQVSPTATIGAVAAPSRATTPSPAAPRSRRTRTSNEGTRRIPGEHSSLPRTPSSLSLVSVL